MPSYDERRAALVKALVRIPRAIYLYERAQTGPNDYDWIAAEGPQAIKNEVAAGRLPEFVLRESHTSGIDGYALKIFLSKAERALSEGLTEEQVRDLLEESQEADMPSGLPQDGSKGQWRTANRHAQGSYAWILGEDTDA